jgi:hypothetical protein
MPCSFSEETLSVCVRKRMRVCVSPAAIAFAHIWDSALYLSKKGVTIAYLSLHFQKLFHLSFFSKTALMSLAKNLLLIF